MVRSPILLALGIFPSAFAQAGPFQEEARLEDVRVTATRAGRSLRGESSGRVLLLMDGQKVSEQKAMTGAAVAAREVVPMPGRHASVTLRATF